MVFSSVSFVVFFALVLLLVRLAGPGRGGRAVLLGASLFFYAFWDIRFVPLLFGLACANFLLGRQVERGARRRAFLIAGVTLNLAVLAVFKYTNFLLSLFRGFSPAGGSRIYIDIIAPLGLSFFVFEFISYLADLYTGRYHADATFGEYLCFVFFFPRLASGPIIRPSAMLPQLRAGLSVTRQGLGEGAQIFVMGLIKKTVIADRMAVCADAVFAAPGVYDTASLWCAAAAYAVQIYCDFSGYSDMAIGLARAMGITLPMNFCMPYLSKNPTEFWRRWHISLSSWLRDYLYIPLGGSRKGSARTKLNLFLTMLLGGLWHGAGLNFLLWGGLHGLGLIAHKAFAALRHPRLPRKLGGILACAVNTLFVCLLWVPFRAATPVAAFSMLSRMFWPAAGAHYLYLPLFTLALPLLVAGHAFRLRLGRREGYLLFDLKHPLPLFGFCLALLGAVFLSADAAQPFIYFQF